MIRYLALGDSYTIGEGVEPAERWPARLAAELRARGCTIGEPEIIAKTGWTTGELAARTASGHPAGPYELVTLLIGVNDQYRGRPIEEYRREFRALLGRAIGFAGGQPGRVIVLSIPDWGVTPDAAGRDRVAIADEIDAFNAVNGEEAVLTGARYVDVTGDSRAHPDEVVSDGLHPSGAQYARWAALVLPTAMSALGLTPAG